MVESSENKSDISPLSLSPVVDFGVLEKVRPFAGDSAVEWVDYIVQQAVMAQKTLNPFGKEALFTAAIMLSRSS
ncbi:hypothetical protein L6452_35884 [Arctium lappa]|uniref:Uncharacterized protein n=1 Tax=Arctium lappa TaxID=4217 RepID=A0ACB8Y7R4_ARCLA|nr:hypothetical protein L6452_35884 [Arctium lappa]